MVLTLRSTPPGSGWHWLPEAVGAGPLTRNPGGAAKARPDGRPLIAHGVCRQRVPKSVGYEKSVLAGNGHVWLIRCGASRGSWRLPRPPVPAPGTPAGPSTCPPQDKSWPRRIGRPPGGPLRRRRSQDDVGEPVPVRLDARMTASAEHDEQFFGVCVERGVQEEQEVPRLDPAELERPGGGSAVASRRARVSRADRCSAGHANSCPPWAPMNSAASAVAVTRMAVPGSWAGRCAPGGPGLAARPVRMRASSGHRVPVDGDRWDRRKARDD
jgi:hypothetical protein